MKIAIFAFTSLKCGAAVHPLRYRPENLLELRDAALTLFFRLHTIAGLVNQKRVMNSQKQQSKNIITAPE